MACEENQKKLIDASLGALSPAVQATLDTHLAVCAGCRAELGRLRELFAELERGVTASIGAEPSADLAARVRIRLGDRRVPVASWLTGRTPVAAGALGLLLATLWVAHRHGNQVNTAQSKPSEAARTSEIARTSKPPQRELLSAMAAISPPAGRRAHKGASRTEPEVLVPAAETEALRHIYRVLQQKGEIDGLSSDVQPAEPVELKIEPLVIAPIEEGGIQNQELGSS